MAQLTRHTHGPEVLAKRQGTCKGCGRQICRGEDYIAVVDRVGAMHAPCARNYCQILEEHLPDDNDAGAESAGEET